ncbi:hypothetical protein ALC56_13922 [Trachymyrmex septentrionalis]|uniref:Uncharacterized protein n=1 Tax=Trachymyrmex septentrionalis TaxID=34720 RepID=A0A195EU60_9HYME|nr:hypothetical protein ALC56_13922 [Trachymyrmex septentrionalis]
MMKGEEEEERKKVGKGKSAVWSKRPRARGNPAGYFCKNISANSKGGSEARRACERVKAYNYDLTRINFDKRSSRADYRSECSDTMDDEKIVNLFSRNPGLPISPATRPHPFTDYTSITPDNT